MGLRTPTIQMKEKKFQTWAEVDKRDWGKNNEQIRFLALHGLKWSEAVAITESDIRDRFVCVSKNIYGIPVMSVLGFLDATIYLDKVMEKDSF